MTLWQKAEIKNCAWCSEPAKVWSPGKAMQAGESTMSTRERYINPDFSGYENVCNVCRKADIEFNLRSTK